MKQKQVKKSTKWLRSLILISGCFLTTFLLDSLGTFSFFENKTYDQRMIYASKKVRASDEIYFIGVNQESIDWAYKNYGWSWPWPREAWAKMIDFFSEGNPKSIAFDILYSEPSIYGPEDDKKFAQSEAKSGKVIQTVFITQNGTSENLLYPIPEIKENAALHGNITSLSDSDGVIRRGRLSYNSKGTILPTLGTAPLFLDDPENAEKLLSSVPVNKDGSIYLRYCKNIDAYNPYWAKDIFESYDCWKNGTEGTYLPEDFEDAYIYVAYYAPGLFDICSTPVSQAYPGVGVHITTLDNLLNNNFIRPVPVWIFIFWLILTAIAGNFSVALSTKINKLRLFVLFLVSGFVFGILVTVLLPYFLFTKSIWLKIVAPLFCFLLSHLLSLGLNMTTEGKQKRFIKSAFSQCLSKDVVNQILNNPDSFTLGGKNYQMSAIFTDIQQFSSISELLTASQLGKLLNFYLTRMSEIIIEERGTIDKFEGDAIIAMVGAPVEMTDHAVHACSAAIKMKKAEIMLNDEIYKRVTSNSEKTDKELLETFKILVINGKKIFTRIGINSGEMIAGYFGSENKKNYTIIGNNVNLASRLEGVNKLYHTGGILISENTYNLISDRFVCRKLDKVRVININTPVRLYELMDFSDNQKVKSYSEKWNSAMDDFENRKYTDALTKFHQLAAENKEDDVVKYYINLLEKYFTKGKYPVEADSEGVSYIPDENVFNILQK
ncbi:MAG: adenylate/guanylate cyclase domain-containing protein [Treponema sp.]|nr:adenylate/guanylate cyclase domain-containing protein [Treponema sp.]MDY5124275.1 adenylate/guanylate cyclase domain-containing protein [Treponema sp.]